MIENRNRIDMDNFRFEMKILNLVFFKFEADNFSQCKTTSIYFNIF